MQKVLPTSERLITLMNNTSRVTGVAGKLPDQADFEMCYLKMFRMKASAIGNAWQASAINPHKHKKRDSERQG